MGIEHNKKSENFEMKYICNKVKSGHCKDVQALSKCVHAVPHDDIVFARSGQIYSCVEFDDCTRKGESKKVKCIEYHE